MERPQTDQPQPPNKRARVTPSPIKELTDEEVEGFFSPEAFTSEPPLDAIKSRSSGLSSHIREGPIPCSPRVVSSFSLGTTLSDDEDEAASSDPPTPSPSSSPAPAPLIPSSPPAPPPHKPPGNTEALVLRPQLPYPFYNQGLEYRFMCDYKSANAWKAYLEEVSDWRVQQVTHTPPHGILASLKRREHLGGPSGRMLGPLQRRIMRWDPHSSGWKDIHNPAEGLVLPLGFFNTPGEGPFARAERLHRESQGTTDERLPLSALVASE